VHLLIATDFFLALSIHTHNFENYTYVHVCTHTKECLKNEYYLVSRLFWLSTQLEIATGIIAFHLEYKDIHLDLPVLNVIIKDFSGLMPKHICVYKLSDTTVKIQANSSIAMYKNIQSSSCVVG